MTPLGGESLAASLSREYERASGGGCAESMGGSSEDIISVACRFDDVELGSVFLPSFHLLEDFFSEMKYGACKMYISCILAADKPR